MISVIVPLTASVAGPPEFTGSGDAPAATPAIARARSTCAIHPRGDLAILALPLSPVISQPEPWPSRASPRQPEPMVISRLHE